MATAQVVVADKGSTVQGAPADNNTSAWTLSAGPAALAGPMINEMMAMYQTIMSDSEKQKENEIDAQAKAANAQAASIEKSGMMQMWQGVASGGTQIVGAAGSALTSAKIGGSEYDPAKAEATTAENEMKPLTEIDKAQKTGTASVGMGETDFVKMEGAELENTTKQMKSGNFGTTKEEQDNCVRALKTLKSTNDPDYDIAKENLNREIDQRQETRSAALKKMSEVTAYRTSMGGMVSQFGQAASSVVSGGLAIPKTQADAAATQQQSAGSLAQGATGTFDGQMSKMYDQELAEVQMLGALARSGEARV